MIRRTELLTVSWNNRLSLALGLPALIYAGVALTDNPISDGAAFGWLLFIGAVF